MRGTSKISASLFCLMILTFLKQFYAFKDFSIGPNAEKMKPKLHCSLYMQECRFQFDTS